MGRERASRHRGDVQHQQRSLRGEGLCSGWERGGESANSQGEDGVGAGQGGAVHSAGSGRSTASNDNAKPQTPPIQAHLANTAG